MRCGIGFKVTRHFSFLMKEGFCNPASSCKFVWHLTKIARIWPRLHERFFARAGDAFFQILWRRQRAMKIASVATHELATRQLKQSQKKSREIQLIQFLAIFFLRFFQLARRQFRGGYTCNFHRALATSQNLKKSHHQREQKIARVAAAYYSDGIT